MPRYDGVVTVDEDEIPVIVELDNEVIRLTAAGKEIGNWHPDECEITHVSDSTYTIEAENEVLEFVPSQPQLFAAALNGVPEPEAPSETAPDDTPVVLEEESAPQPLTMGLFYGLCFLTAALAMWAFVSMVT
jgi:hypothetical protein